MLDFLKFQPKAFGLDISDFSLKIVQLKKNGKKSSPISWLRRAIAPGIIEKGRIKKEAELVEILKEAKKEVRGQNLSTKYAVCALPEEEAFFRVIQLPPNLNDEEINRILKYEIESYVPMKAEELYYDYQIIPNIAASIRHTNVLTAAIPKSIADSYISVFNKADIHPFALEIESQATARALVADGKSPHPVIILDIGASGTGWTIFSGETIFLTGHINVSGTDFTNLIAKNLNLDFKEAENLKEKLGLQKGRKNEKVWESLIPIFTDLTEQIKNLIDFYKEHGEVEFAPDGRIVKILLCGGDSLIPGFPEFLKESLNLPVELGSPWVNIHDSENPKVALIPNEEPLTFVTALGLALRGIALD